MALFTTKTLAELGAELVLAPERYDPRRESLNGAPDAVPLTKIATTVRSTVSPLKHAAVSYLVLDTSDVREGVVVGQKSPVAGSGIGSAKKLPEPNDVIISRLRPYLRQIAFVDSGIWNLRPGVQLACSTEFYVLRSLNDESIAFLVPFLLSRSVQEVLAASQEGGHHPRVNESILLSLPVPRGLLNRRNEISQAIESGVQHYRQCEAAIAEMIGAVEARLLAVKAGG